MKTIRMRKEDWAKWDAALRSGEYVQGIETLHSDDGKYCCLGVLQKVLDGDVERDAGNYVFDLPSIDWLNKHAIEFDSSEPVIDCSPCQSPYLPSLMETADAANDTGKTFVEIADAIKDCVEFTAAA